jgi:hypothetical protein
MANDNECSDYYEGEVGLELHEDDDGLLEEATPAAAQHDQRKLSSITTT